MTLENQRYGRNKAALVNKKYIESGDYRAKFDRITENPEINRILYAKAKEILLHRSGTLLILIPLRVSYKNIDNYAEIGAFISII